MMIVPGHYSDIIELMRVELFAFEQDGYDINTINRLIKDSILFLKMINPIDMSLVGFSICSNMMGEENVKETQAVELITLAIHPKFQRQGFGNRLLQRTLVDLQRFNVQVVQLHVKVSNEKAINLYKKHGFKIVETIEEYYDDSKESAYTMILMLTKKSKAD
ncbi:Mycothiol acetyltransferase [Candidatus Lokiarchaeum ossiferum]|uniref:Mycothiol acetyltransferase n=1 Tax=Candidatus Lokiarchaeum ossiferum TaxID=2951803 RepID=A0ABY6HRT1_9ARCH|nr:Mycothiol acetyltransferase [Candidatus Lokiarchaeum sp. B-35]